MAAPIRDNLEFLLQAKASLQDATQAQAKAKDLGLEVMNLEKSLQDEEKAKNDLLETTIKNRRSELSATYDEEISKTRDRIKEENVKRQKAIAYGKKARSKQETQGLMLENRELKKQMKEMFRTEKMPAFCNSTIYYGLFGPGSGTEVLIFIIALLIFLGAVPLSVYHFVPWTGTVFLALVYVVDVIVFGGIYMLISNLTRGKHNKAFRDGKNIRRKILQNKKQAARIEKGIAKDTDESHYDLDEFDMNIEKMKADLDEIMARRSEAMTNFEEVTKHVITDDIEDSCAEKMRDIQVRLESAKYRKEQAEDDARTASLGFTDEYGPYIDRSYWNDADMDALIALVESGEAKTIMEAQTMYKAQKGK